MLQKSALASAGEKLIMETVNDAQSHVGDIALAHAHAVHDNAYAYATVGM